MDNSGLVKGLPKFKLYRQFVEDTADTFHREKVDESRSRELIDRIEQIELVSPEGLRLFFEAFMSTAKVVELRRHKICNVIDYEVVEYAGRSDFHMPSFFPDVHLIVAYDNEGRLQNYTFPYRDPFPMRTSQNLDNASAGSRHWEDVIEYMCDEDRFKELRVHPEDSKTSICVKRSDDKSEWQIEWEPYGVLLFSIVARTKYQWEALACVRQYMRHGTSDALEMFDDWSAVYRDDTRSSHHVPVSSYLTAKYLQASRKGDVEWLRLISVLETCGITGRRERLYSHDDEVPRDSESRMLQSLYVHAKADLEGGDEEGYLQKMLYLALHNHEDACWKIADKLNDFDRIEDISLFRFWSDKGAKASKEPREDGSD